jgi:hypothetical protein
MWTSTLGSEDLSRQSKYLFTENWWQLGVDSECWVAGTLASGPRHSPNGKPTMLHWHDKYQSTSSRPSLLIFCPPLNLWPSLFSLQLYRPFDGVRIHFRRNQAYKDNVNYSLTSFRTLFGTRISSNKHQWSTALISEESMSPLSAYVLRSIGI